MSPVRFRPLFDKWAHEICDVVRLHVAEPAAVRSVELTIAILQAVQELATTDFKWLPPPYEYEYERPPIDILFGSDRLRCQLTEQTSSTLSACDHEQWRERTAPLQIHRQSNRHS